MSIWTRKSFASVSEAETPSGSGLRRELAMFHLVMIGVGSTIGAGIFVITGTAAAQYAGPAISISFLIAGLACLFSALCYAELTSMIPVAGSAYTYAYVTLGEGIAWVIGWCLILEYLVAASTVAVGWSGYFAGTIANLGMAMPVQLANAPLGVSAQGLTFTGAVLNLPAVGIVLAMTGVLFVGVRESAIANSILVSIKIGIILLVILFGAAHVDTHNWHPFVPTHNAATGAFGWSGVFRASGVIFFSYVGFDTISTSAQESRDPQRSLGWAILIALAICTALYVGMSLVMTGLVAYTRLNAADPILVAIEAAGPDLVWMRPMVSVAAIIGLASTIMVTLYGQTRIFYTMAQDGLLPPLFAKLHVRFRSPALGTLIVGISCAAIAGLFPLDVLSELVSMGTLLAFAIVCAGVLILRHREPEAPRKFKVAFSPFVPLAGMGSAIYLITSLPSATWSRLAVWMVIGGVIYFAYSAPRSHAARTEIAKP